jgi:hypothetical protein
VHAGKDVKKEWRHGLEKGVMAGQFVLLQELLHETPESLDRLLEKTVAELTHRLVELQTRPRHRRA